MKSLQELAALQEKAKAAMQDSSGGGEPETRILVGLATCGIAAGARPVLEAFEQEIKRRGLKNIQVRQTGCIGVCQYEPVAEIFVPGKEKVTYVKMSADKVAEIVTEHLVNGRPVHSYTVGAYSE